jgi:hypothetical protein
MGDYVLDSNPALERLIERLGAKDKPPPPEERSGSHGYSTLFRRRRRPTVHAVDSPGIGGGNPSPAGVNDPADRAKVAKAPTAEEAAFDENLRAIREDFPADDELVLVDFDEDAELFAEDPEDQREDENEADAADAFLEVYEREEPNPDENAAYDDGVRVDVVGVENDRGDWILDAFKNWMLESAEAH